MGRSRSAWRCAPLLWLAACPIKCDESLGVAPGAPPVSMVVESISNPFSPNAPRVELVPGGNTSEVRVILSRNTVNAPRSFPVQLSTGPLPNGVTATFDPPVVFSQDAGETSSSLLTLSGSAAALAGPLSLEVLATATLVSPAFTARLIVDGEIVRPFRLQLLQPLRPIEAGTTGTIRISSARRATFDGIPTLRVDQATLPMGAVVTIPAPSVTHNVAMSVPASAPVGTYRVRAFGSYGVNADTLDFDLAVTAPPAPSDFSMAVQPSAATVAPGGTGSFGLAFARTGSIGDVVLAASGLPPGATAAFSPATVTGTSAQVTIGTSGTTPDGTYSVVITGTSGTLVRQATVSLTVTTPPDFTLALAPAAVTVARGGTGQANITLQRTGNPGSVQLAVSGMPNGVTAAITPSATMGTTATVAVSVSPTAPAGTYPLVVTGTAGTLSRTATLSLTIPAPPPSLVSIELLASSVTVASGATTTIPVRLTRTGSAVGQQLELRVAGLPAGGAAWVTPSFTTGDTATLQIVGGTVGTSTISVSAVVGANPPTASVTVNVVTPSTPDFSLVPSATTLGLVRSGPFTPITLDIRRVAGFSSAVVLDAITDQPGAYAVNISPGSTSGTSALVEIYVSELVSPGVHVLVLRGTSGGLVRTARLTIVVR